VEIQLRNRQKTVTVRYAFNGMTNQVVVNDGDMLRLPYSNNNSQDTLQINRAIYGSGSRTYDVTSRLNSQMRNDQLNVQVNSNTMGGDPAPNQAKVLTVQYAVNGQTNQVIVNDGDMLRLTGNSNIGNGLSQEFVASRSKPAAIDATTVPRTHEAASDLAAGSAIPSASRVPAGDMTMVASG